MKYEVVIQEGHELEGFASHVQDMIDDGWEPLGGISVVCVGHYGDNSIYAGSPILRFHQAMTRIEDHEA